MASLRNLMIRLGIDYDETGSNKLSKGLDSVAKKIERTSGALDKMRLPAAAVGMASMAGAATTAAVSLVPLAASAGAMPAIFAANKAAALTLKVAMTGVGEAMSAVATGDAKALKEALKNLSPEAQKFVKASGGFLKSFDPIRKGVQERLFENLSAQVAPLAKNILPSAQRGMNGVATSFNKGAIEATKFGASPIARGALNSVFKTTQTVLNQASTAVRPFLGAISKLVILGAPLAKQMASWAINGVKTGSAWITSANGAQKLSEWMARAGVMLGQLGRIGRNVVTFVVNLFSQANTNGADFLGTLERLTAKMATWSKSAQGQQEAANTFKLLGDVFRQLATILPIVLGPLGAIAKLIGSMPPDVQGTVTTVLALSVVAGALGGKLALLGGVIFKTGAGMVQFAGGLIKGSSALANNASFASKAGGALRSFGSTMVAGIAASGRMVVTLSAQAGAWALNTTRMVASKVAMIATTVASKAMAIGIRLVNAAMRANPIGIVITLILGLVAILVLAYKKNETFRKIVDAVWKGIQAAIKFAVDRVIKPVIQWLYNFIVKDLGPRFMWFHRTVVAPVMAKIGEIVKTVIEKVKSHFMFMHKLITVTIPNGFKLGVAAIGRFWTKVQEVAKKPVTFLVNTVYNNGIRKVWNWVASKVGLGQLNPISGFARGGVLPGYSRKDDQLIAARSGESIFVPEFTKAVGPNWVYGMNALARRGGPRAVANAMTGSGQGIPGFENGGIVGFIGGFFKKAKDFFVNGFVKAAQGALNPIVNVMQSTVGGTAFGQMLVKAVSTIIQNVVNKFKPFESELGGGDASGVVKAAARYIGQGDRGRDNDNKFNDKWGYPVGTPWCANFVSTAISDAKASKKYKGYPTAAVNGYYSKMNKVGVGNARPGDLGVYYGPTGHINIVSKKLGGNNFETIGGNEGPRVRRAVRSSAYSILRPGGELGGIVELKKIFQQKNEDKADRRNPMRMLQAGQLKPFRFDSGGVWEPGTLGYNGTREPEYVYTRRQKEGLGGRGDNYNITFQVSPGTNVREFEDAVYRAIVNYKKRNRGTKV